MKHEDLITAIRSKRAGMRLSQDDVVSGAGVTKATYVRLEKGENVGVKTLCKVLEFLELKIV